MTNILDRIRQHPVPSELVGDSGVHYDTPPRIFELLLDRNMNYSSGVYPNGDEDLDSAQLVKMGKIARWLDLKPGACGCSMSGAAGSGRRCTWPSTTAPRSPASP